MTLKLRSMHFTVDVVSTVTKQNKLFPRWNKDILKISIFMVQNLGIYIGIDQRCLGSILSNWPSILATSIIFVLISIDIIGLILFQAPQWLCDIANIFRKLLIFETMAIHYEEERTRWKQFFSPSSCKRAGIRNGLEIPVTLA